MSVGEWLNTVIQPADDHDDEAWWSADVDHEAEDRSAARSQYDDPDREPPRNARSSWSPSWSPWRERDRRAEEPHRPEPHYDDEPDDRHRNGSARRRDRDFDEPRRQRPRGDDETSHRKESSYRESSNRSRRRAAENWERDGWERQDRERQAQQRHERERQERELQEREGQQPERQERERQPRERRERERREWERQERERQEREHEVRGRQEREARERQELEARERQEREARERQEREAWERQEREARERQEREARERQEREARERQELDRQERERQERAERQRVERQRFEQAAAGVAAKQRRDESIDTAVAEITARQRALDRNAAADHDPRPPGRVDPVAAAAPRYQPPPPAPPLPPTTPERERVFAAWPGGWRSQAAGEAPVDISGLEEQLRQMTARIEALRPSSELEKAIVGLRADLAEIGRSFTEALPRRALESLEIEVKALGERINHSRQAGVDATALAGIERGLAEVHAALNGLTPAEGLIGFSEAVKGLGNKIDAIAAKDDPGTLQQLEAAIGSLRGIVSHVASNDTLTKVADEVRALSAKVDGLAASAPGAPTLAALENRIDILASALNASTEAGHAVPRELEKLLASMVDKLEHVQLTQADHTALSHLEDRIAGLVKRLDASDARLGLLEGVERGLADLLVYIDQLRDSATVGAKMPAAASAIGQEFATTKQSSRLPPNALDAAVEDVRAPAAPVADRRGGGKSDSNRSDTSRSDSWTDRPKATIMPPMPSPAVAPPPLSVHEFDELDMDAVVPDTRVAEPLPRPGVALPQRAAAPRTPIDPSLPPDHPLEPGSAARSRNGPSTAERIATSEAAAGSKPPVIPDPGAGKPDFIAAARRAAQAAAAASPEGKRLAKAGVEGPVQSKKFSERLRMLAVAAAVVVIVVGGFHYVTRLFDDGSSTPPPAQTQPSAQPQTQTEPPSTQTPPPAAQPQSPARKEPPHVEADPQPSTNSATTPPPAALPAAGTLPSAPAESNAPAGSKTPAQQSRLNSYSGPIAMALGPRSPDATATGGRESAVSAAAGAPMDITGSVPNAAPPNAVPPNALPPSAATPRAAAAATSSSADRLPAAIGGSTLRLAALAGDPLAAYEVGVRFSEGRVVPANNEEAARWFDIAAKKGIVPAQFRLGTLYEKGLGVKKDLAAARNLYRAAADKGHGKAMHNLAVLYAEGIDGKPDYNTAAQWFRKAADYGITDSQYNLAILYARGVGVDQNLAEAYKWFFLAAKEGDQDAAQKRDQIATRLDPRTLAAARAAAENWTAIPQPAEAITVKGAWDSPANATPPTPKPRPRSARAATALN